MTGNCSASQRVLANSLRVVSAKRGNPPLRGNSCSSTLLQKIKVSSTKLRDKLQFANSVKHLVLNLTKIPFFKRLISIPRLIFEVLNDQNLFTESNLANWFSSYVEFCSGGHFSERAEAA